MHIHPVVCDQVFRTPLGHNVRFLSCELACTYHWETVHRPSMKLSFEELVLSRRQHHRDLEIRRSKMHRPRLLHPLRSFPGLLDDSQSSHSKFVASLPKLDPWTLYP